jgi:hypothetical protein
MLPDAEWFPFGQEDQELIGGGSLDDPVPREVLLGTTETDDVGSEEESVSQVYKLEVLPTFSPVPQKQ